VSSSSSTAQFARQALADRLREIRLEVGLTARQDRLAELVAESRAVDSLWLDWRRVERTGLRQAQESVRELYERTRLFRFCSSWMIPGPVQTADYVTTILSAIRDRRELPNDVEAAVAERIDRQHIVHDGVHRSAGRQQPRQRGTRPSAGRNRGTGRSRRASKARRARKPQHRLVDDAVAGRS
jgi:Domain of unknown function (DUF5753)